MMDIKAMGVAQPKAKDEYKDYTDQIKKSIGSGFSDKPEEVKAKKQLGKDDFLRLMSVQLQYQDPISPMKNEEMAAQMAQFSALEQMVNMNTTLEKMAHARPAENIMTSTLIGKNVTTDSSQFAFEKAKPVELQFDLTADIAKGTFSVVDARGNIVRELDLGAMKAGPQKITWDGKNHQGFNADSGEYQFRIVASKENDQPVDVKVGTSGVVTGVVFEKGKPHLMIGAKKVPIEAVSAISEVVPQTAQNNVQTAQQAQSQVQTQPQAQAQQLLQAQAQEPPQTQQAVQPQQPEAVEGSVANVDGDVDPRQASLEGMDLWNPLN